MVATTIYKYYVAYLGGTVDLPRLHDLITTDYPGAKLEIQREKRVLTVPLAAGTIPDGRGQIPFSATVYQFENGFGPVVMQYRIGEAPSAARRVRIDRAIADHDISQELINYLQRCFGIASISQLFVLLRRPEGLAKMRQDRGIDMMRLGLDQFYIAINDIRGSWTVGPRPAGAPAAELSDITGGNHELYLRGNESFWSPREDGELFWDLLLVQLRECALQQLNVLAKGWLEFVLKQFTQTEANLRKKNEELWAQDREEVESMDIYFHLFSGYARRLAGDLELSGCRGYSFSPLRRIDAGAWEAHSYVGRNLKVLDATLNETRQSIERMTRPLDFREFKLLKSGVEEVEARIMLLTVLLVVMELFAKFGEPGHGAIKMLLLAVIVSLPLGYMAWNRVKRRRLLRHSRISYLEFKKADVEKQIGLYQRELDGINSRADITSDVQRAYRSLYSELLARFREQVDEYDRELKSL